ncbi:hypothetical protein RHGRI_008809 [Rhododendron griersonianum]|uniref:Uncharacterized protein n=1 Tax=Rhododendron griersonianum TaxID=479676 RepID=A0AAV6L2S2_9ERIC|nr:hypothetical protein RHGRI_008809 [Rhododendron griersonianum]
MERKDKVICSVVGFLGLLSAALSFAAEGTKTTVSQVVFTSPTSCIYPSSPALGLGLAAAVTLLVLMFRFITYPPKLMTWNIYWWKKSRWITFVIAFLMLLTSAALNEQEGEENMYFGCYVVKPGVFAGAAVLSLATVALGIVYYLALESAKIKIGSLVGTAAAPNQSSIAMGQPQFPPPQFPPPDTEAPVFVHEDTYMRRQFT